jgi:ribonuclease HI
MKTKLCRGARDFTNNQAKKLALYPGLNVHKSKGINNLIVIKDSSIIIQQR